ncbi:MAG: trehalose-phosphatase [Povalibacter sp.]
MTALPPPPLPSVSNLALFLDVDGTLLDIAPTPESVVVSEQIKHLLDALCSRLDGALALVSGRSIRTLDTLFDPLRFAAAGIHGCERREASGCILRPEVDVARVAAVRDELTAWTLRHPGTLLEDKGYALALHYRLAPEFEVAALSEAESALGVLATHELQRGKFVFEIRPSGYSKGGAIEAFMREQPFRGRQPLFIGDDVTDEAGFESVNLLQGISVRVGDFSSTAARYRLPNVQEVIRWLGALLSTE